MSPLGTKVSSNPFDSDSDDDDYVPQANEESSSSESENDDATTQPIVLTEEEQKREEEEKKKTRDALWSSFQASVSQVSPNPTSQPSEPKLVKVERRYRFAGEEIVEVIEVPEDSPEAKQWPLWKDPNSVDQKKVDSVPLDELTPPSLSTKSSQSPVPEAAQPLSTTLASSDSTPKPIKRPGPRKPKTVLASIPGPSKAKKITTLGKSLMDWQTHIQAEEASGTGVKDELEANRRGGGYLEKVEFLKRVEERKEDALDTLKSNKRRKL